MPTRTVPAVPPCVIEPIEWEMVYPIPVNPIVRIRRRAGRFEAKLADEYLGAFANGDSAAKEVWDRFTEQSRVQHE